MPATSWTKPDDLIARLRQRWDRGDYLKGHARGEPFEPVDLPIRGPRPDDLLNDPAGVTAWAEGFRRASVDRSGRPRFRLEQRTLRNRVLGDNDVPARLRVESLAELAALVGAGPELSRLDDVLAATQERLEPATAWVADHPREAVAHHDVWERILTVVAWMVDHDPAALDIRHVDIAGVDTKFIERHRKVLSQLLDAVLPASRIDPTARDFAGRYGFRPRPTYVRLRLLAPVPTFPAAVTELELRADELARLPLPVSTVFVIENMLSYLAFPSVSDAIAVFGKGFAVTTLELVPWVSERQVIYWGDIDTHGFDILDRLRQRLPATKSILMDRATLLAHRAHLTTEDTPTRGPLSNLTDDEAALHRDLLEDRYGPAVRLEQERVRFSLVQAAAEAACRRGGGGAHGRGRW